MQTKFLKKAFVVVYILYFLPKLDFINCIALFFAKRKLTSNQFITLYKRLFSLPDFFMKGLDWRLLNSSKRETY